MVVPLGRIVWARSATKHRVSKSRSRFVIEHCGWTFEVPPMRGTSASRVVFLGDDAEGCPLEVMAVKLEDGDLLVIHAMEIRERYRPLYEEAKEWRI